MKNIGSPLYEASFRPTSSRCLTDCLQYLPCLPSLPPIHPIPHLPSIPFPHCFPFNSSPAFFQCLPCFSFSTSPACHSVPPLLAIQCLHCLPFSASPACHLVPPCLPSVPP